MKRYGDEVEIRSGEGTHEMRRALAGLAVCFDLIMVRERGDVQ